MQNTQKFLILIIVVLLAVISYLLLTRSETNSVINQSNNSESRTLTETEARDLVIGKWGGCTPDSCSRVEVSVELKNNQYYVTATYEGLRDDSSSAQRRVSIATYSNNGWSLGEPVVTQACQPNRGHQDFTSEPCI